MINMLHSPNVTIFLQRESSYVPHCIHMGNTGLEESINLESSLLLCHLPFQELQSGLSPHTHHHNVCC
jgi:hypothetical protein